MSFVPESISTLALPRSTRQGALGRRNRSKTPSVNVPEPVLEDNLQELLATSGNIAREQTAKAVEIEQENQRLQEVSDEQESNLRKAQSSLLATEAELNELRSKYRELESNLEDAVNEVNSRTDTYAKDVQDLKREMNRVVTKGQEQLNINNAQITQYEADIATLTEHRAGLKRAIEKQREMMGKGEHEATALKQELHQNKSIREQLEAKIHQLTKQQVSDEEHAQLVHDKEDLSSTVAEHERVIQSQQVEMDKLNRFVEEQEGIIKRLQEDTETLRDKDTHMQDSNLVGDDLQAALEKEKETSAQLRHTLETKEQEIRAFESMAARRDYWNEDGRPKPEELKENIERLNEKADLLQVELNNTVEERNRALAHVRDLYAKLNKQAPSRSSDPFEMDITMNLDPDLARSASMTSTDTATTGLASTEPVGLLATPRKFLGSLFNFGQGTGGTKDPQTLQRRPSALSMQATGPNDPPVPGELMPGSTQSNLNTGPTILRGHLASGSSLGSPGSPFTPVTPTERTWGLSGGGPHVPGASTPIPAPMRQGHAHGPTDTRVRQSGALAPGLQESTVSGHLKTLPVTSDSNTTAPTGSSRPLSHTNMTFVPVRKTKKPRTSVRAIRSEANIFLREMKEATSGTAPVQPSESYNPGSNQQDLLSITQKDSSEFSRRAPSSWRHAEARRIKDEAAAIARDVPVYSFWQRFIRDTARDITGCTIKQDIEGYDPIDPDIAENYEERGGPGPNPEAPVFDFRINVSMQHPWNNACLDHAVSLVRKNVESAKEMTKFKVPGEVPDHYLKHQLFTMMTNYKSEYQSTRVREQEDGTLEDLPLRATRVAEERTTRSRLGNKMGRRTHLLRIRLDIVDRMSGDPAIAENDVAQLKWLQLKALLSHLGPEGTSSDEEGAGGMEYHVNKMPWRNEDVTRWLKFIDDRYWNVKSRVGPRIRRRVRDNAPSLSERDPPANLPPWFYNPSYSHIPIHILTQNKEQFNMPIIGLDSVEGLATNHPLRLATR